MKVDLQKQPRTNRVRVLVSPMTDKGKPVGAKAGYPKGKHITLYDTSVDEVYEVILEALIEAANYDKGGI